MHWCQEASLVSFERIHAQEGKENSILASSSASSSQFIVRVVFSTVLECISNFFKTCLSEW